MELLGQCKIITDTQPLTDEKIQCSYIRQYNKYTQAQFDNEL